MKLHDLLKNRSIENVIYDFSDLSRDELELYISSRIYGEESLTDLQLQQLNEGISKIRKRPGKPCNFKSVNVEWDGRDETARDFVLKYLKAQHES